MKCIAKGRRAFFVATLTCAALIGACASATEPETPWLRIEPTESNFSPGDLVTAVLRNVGMISIELDGCFPQLERFERGRWTEVQVTPRANCGETAVVVSPGGTHPIGIDYLPQDLEPGTYRYRFKAGYLNAGDRRPLTENSLLSAPFLVT